MALRISMFAVRIAEYGSRPVRREKQSAEPALAAAAQLREGEKVSSAMLRALGYPNVIDESDITDPDEPAV